MSGENLSDISDNAGQDNDSGSISDSPSSAVSDNNSEGSDSSRGAAAQALDYNSLVGQTLFEKYQITHVLSLNDISVVYKATDMSENKTVVMKTLVARDREVRKLFFQEIRKLESIKHQNVVQFLEFKAPFYVMEFLDGISFDKVLGKAPKIDSPSHLVKIIEPVCKGIAYVHQSQVIHGRVSPSDVILVKENGQHVVKLVGLGCSKIQAVLSETGVVDVSSPFLNSDHEPNYEPSIQDDVYGIGALVYNMVTGRLPFVSADGQPMDSLEPIASISPKLANVEELDEIVLKALSRDPDVQFPSVHHLRSAISNWSKPREAEVAAPEIVAEAAPAAVPQPAEQVAPLQPEEQAAPDAVPQPTEQVAPAAAPQALPEDGPPADVGVVTGDTPPVVPPEPPAFVPQEQVAAPAPDLVSNTVPDAVPDATSTPFRSRLQEAVASVASSEAKASMTPRMMLDFGDADDEPSAPEPTPQAQPAPVAQVVNPQAAPVAPTSGGIGPGIAGFGPGIPGFAPNAPGLTTSGSHPLVEIPPQAQVDPHSRQATGPLPPGVVAQQGVPYQGMPPQEMPPQGAVDPSVEMHENLAPIVVPGGPGAPPGFAPGAPPMPGAPPPVPPGAPDPMAPQIAMPPGTIPPQAMAPQAVPPQVGPGEEVYFLGQTLFDRYSVLDAIGETDVSIVYAAKDLIDERLVAIKTIKMPDPELTAAFSKGVQEISSYSNKSIVPFLGFKQNETHPFYIMDLVEALTLADLVGERIEKEDQIGECMQQLCEAIGYIHSAKRHHGNLTPRCIMLAEEGEKLVVKISGMGTEGVRAVRASRGTLPLDINVYPNADLFNQIGRTQRGDIFACAAILYQMITGRLPFDAQAKIIPHVEPVSKLRPELAGVGILDDVFGRAFNPDPAKQFETIGALGEGLREWVRLIHGEAMPSPEKPHQQSGMKRWTKEAKVPDMAHAAPPSQLAHDPTSMDDFAADHKPMLKAEAPSTPPRRWSREVAVGEPDDHEHLREDIAGLKNRQVQQEGTLIIKVAKAVGGGRSPMRVMVETGLLVVGGCLCLIAVGHYAFTNYDSLSQQWMNASRRLSSQVSGSEWTPSSGTGFDYKKDSKYQPWSNNKVIGEPRVVGPDGVMETK